MVDALDGACDFAMLIIMLVVEKWTDRLRLLQRIALEACSCAIPFFDAEAELVTILLLACAGQLMPHGYGDCVFSSPQFLLLSWLKLNGA